MNTIDITALLNSGSSDSFQIPNTQYGVVEVPASPGSLVKGVRELQVKGDARSAAPDISVLFVETCLPEFPVYIRWVNRLGGFEYHMFHGSKTFGQSVERGDTFYVSGGNSLDATETQSELAPTVEDSVACGDEQLTWEMFKFLRGIITSPRIDVYDPKRELFVRALLTDTNVEWNTSFSRGTINLELKLLNQAIQF